jgi:hypothetical protein
MPRPADSLLREAYVCPCGRGRTPLCARCECLTQLAVAEDVWRYEQVTGTQWEVVVQRRESDYTVLKRRRGWNGWGDTLLGLACEGLAVACYVCWVLPRTMWLRWTGRIPRRED